MPGIDPLSHLALLLRRRKPVLVIVTVGILAFIIWTLPNWKEFWDNLPQFPILWQIPENRRIIIYLTIKITSPLLLIGITGIIVWLYYLIQSSQGEEGTDDAQPEQVQHGALAEKMIYRSTSSSTLEQTPKTQAVSFSAPLRSQAVSVSRGYNPETPLPPTLSLTLAPGKQVEEANRPTFLVKDEQSVVPADQKRDVLPVRANLTVAPLQASNLSQPLAVGGEQVATSKPVISIRLLKDVSMRINVPGGGHVVVPLTLNAKRVQLLAYIAWRRGELIDRDKILEHVFGWGLADEDATEDKLSERFESHKKLLRKKIREVVIEHVNGPAGRQVIDPDLDPFVSDSGFWGLADCCRVDDLDIIETNHKILALARKDGKLVDEIPEYVWEACERLIASYSGDFLESLIKKYPGEFRPWQGRSSWVRKPYTQFRDYYLDALWYAAEYERQMGLRYGDGGTEMGEANLRKQQEYFGRAAQKFQSYAMYSCNSKFDSKVTFGPHGEYGERVGMSERALRRCIVLLGAIGRTDLINQVWSAYVTQMKSISDHRWQPSRETQDDVQAAKAQTSAYRFAAQVAQMSDFVERQDRVS
jgi:hypothetical protein